MRCLWKSQGLVECLFGLESMETPQSEGAPKPPLSEGSTLRRGEHAREAIASTASLDHLQIADLGQEGSGQRGPAAPEPDEKAETVIRRPETGSSVRVSSRPSPATPAEVAGVLLGSRMPAHTSGECILRDCRRCRKHDTQQGDGHDRLAARGVQGPEQEAHQGREGHAVQPLRRSGSEAPP
jgi:hypothetical protein